MEGWTAAAESAGRRQFFSECSVLITIGNIWLPTKNTVVNKPLTAETISFQLHQKTDTLWLLHRTHMYSLCLMTIPFLFNCLVTALVNIHAQPSKLANERNSNSTQLSKKLAEVALLFHRVTEKEFKNRSNGHSLISKQLPTVCVLSRTPGNAWQQVPGGLHKEV